MIIKPIIIEPSSTLEFQEYYKIRFEELRKPWEQLRGSEKDSIEDKCIHKLILYSDDFAGVARLQYNTNFQAQIRYMAVRRKYRKLGFGQLLVEDLEKVAKNNNISEIILQSREKAIPFYLKLNYKIIKKSYILFDEIQHFLMRKYL